MRSAMGVPVVLPSYTPERISTRSSSRRWVTWREVPGFRRSRSGWMSASESSIPGGQPSITHPIAGPWDSPKVVTVKRVPRVEPDMDASLLHRNFALLISELGFLRSQIATLKSSRGELSRHQTHAMAKPLDTSQIAQRVRSLRGVNVLLDADLAELSRSRLERCCRRCGETRIASH